MKTVIDRRVVAATEEARLARARLLATVDELRHRLDPRVVASDTFDHALSSATRFIVQTTAAARSRPLLLGLGATAAGLLIAVRARQSGGRDKATNQDDES